jgi:uncharacterized GH25 family protein
VIRPRLHFSIDMSIRIHLTRVFVALCTALLGGPVLAHDFWIEPGNFRPRLGEPMNVRLRVGEHLQGDAVPFAPARVQHFIVHDGANRRTVSARPGSEPAGALRIVNPGMHVVGYHSHASRVELPADKFDAYLIEEGLDAVAAQRPQRPANDGKVRERFIRCAKSLVLAGTPGEEQGDRQLGFPLELLAQSNPYRLLAGEELTVLLNFQNRPLTGALVVAMNSLNPADTQRQRSDDAGRARFRVPPGGLWLVKAVHMVAAAPGEDADWTSYWASLTFETHAAITAAQ